MVVPQPVLCQACVTRLGLTKTQSTAEITGLSAHSVGKARGVTTLAFSPYFSPSPSFVVSALVINKVTGRLPCYPCDPSLWSHLNGLKLADPHFYKPAPIDVLLGSDVFWNLLEDGKRVGAKNSPLGFCSSLSWLVAGNIESGPSHVRVHYTDTDLDNRLRSFWELESLPSQRSMTAEEVSCECHFLDTYSRNESGIFTVKLPLKSQRPTLGASRDAAVCRLKQLERRLVGNPSHQRDYINFMREYEFLGHCLKFLILKYTHQ